MEELTQPLRDHLLLRLCELVNVPVEDNWFLFTLLAQIVGVYFLFVDYRGRMSHVNDVLNSSLDVQTLD
jgi:hypothetical protein